MPPPLPPSSRRDVLAALATLLVGSQPERAFAQTKAQPPAPPAGSAPASTPGRVSIVPFGAVSELEVGVVQRSLLAFYSLDIRAVDRRPLPRAAYYPKRGRYRAERLLSELEHDADPSATRILGLASVDISTTKGNIEDWGILGLASLDGRVGVLSSFRCRRRARSPEQVAHRLGKTAVHELGHTFGLEHCPSAGCLMRDGQGSVLTTDEEYDLCAICRLRLASRELLLQPSRVPPWPRPT